MCECVSREREREREREFALWFGLKALQFVRHTVSCVSRAFINHNVVCY